MRLALNDVRASVVVFLVALPLCLGIALASNAPLSSGILAGILGGLIIGSFGGSHVSVSGPAAGLTMIVAGAIEQLGGFSSLSSALILAGVIQFAFGILKAGELGHFFPSSVIKGMLAAIGLILILKQLPHAIGWDVDYMGDESFSRTDGSNTFSDLILSLSRFHVGATIISLASICLMLFWDKIVTKRKPILANVPSALIAVATGIIINEALLNRFEFLSLRAEQFVRLPFQGGITGLFSNVSLPNLNAFGLLTTWKVAVTIAIVASLETLLSLDAADKIDPLKRISRKNKELRAQGFGNFLCGLIGALPITAVIVRTSANVTAGGLTRVSAILHAMWMMLAVILFPSWLDHIPLASLAAILILIGWKLTTPALFRQQWNLGKAQFIPFVVTVIMILLTDLLVGITIGLAVGVVFVLISNAHSSVVLVKQDLHTLMRFSKDVSFLQKARVRALLRDLPDGGQVVIDGSRSVHVDHDITELIEDFLESAPSRNIKVQLQKSPLALCALFKE